MEWQTISNYGTALIAIPLIVMTLRKFCSNFKSIFDDDLTIQDRRILQQTTFLVILPIVVLIHEIAHALTAMAMGSRVVDFQWSLFWGQVSHTADIAPWQNYLIAVAGVASQIFIGSTALLIASKSRSAAVITLSVYIFLFTWGHALILYPFLSPSLAVSDFDSIYSGATPEISLITGIVHVFLLTLYLYLLIGSKSKLWFNQKTRPAWYKQYCIVKQRADQAPTGVNLLSLAWQYYLVDLDKLCLQTLDHAEAKDPSLLETWLLHGYVEMNKQHYKTAMACFEKIIDISKLEAAEQTIKMDPRLLARTYMSIGHCLAQEALVTKKQNHQAILDTYHNAIQADHTLLDPYYYLAVTLLGDGKKDQAMQYIRQALTAEKEGREWLDTTLPRHCRELLLESKQVEQEQKSGQ